MSRKDGVGPCHEMVTITLCKDPGLYMPFLLDLKLLLHHLCLEEEDKIFTN